MKITSITEERLRNLKEFVESKSADKTTQEAYLETHEEFDPGDSQGGKYDDIYDIGIEDGEILMARSILAILKGE